MPSVHRLEDLLPAWRADCAPALTACAAAFAKQASALLPARLDTANPKVAEAVATLAEVAEQLTVDDLLPKCFTFLKSQDVVEEVSQRQRTEAAVALKQRLPKFSPALPASEMKTPYGMWSLLAAGGAALGAVALAPLSDMIFDRKNPGLFVGGILGAGGFVGLVAWLSERPGIRRSMETVLTLAAGGSLLAGAFAFYKSRSSMPLNAAGWTFFCWLLLFFTRPRLTGARRDACREAMQPQIQHWLANVADLVLAVAWHHPDREKKSVTTNVAIPAGIADSLGVLSAMNLDDKVPEKQLRGALRSLLQRVSEEGYEWQSLPDGTPFDPSFEDRFDSFGIIEKGQPVETLEPVRLRDGKPDKRGQLRAR